MTTYLDFTPSEIVCDVTPHDPVTIVAVVEDPDGAAFTWPTSETTRLVIDGGPTISGVLTQLETTAEIAFHLTQAQMAALHSSTPRPTTGHLDVLAGSLTTRWAEVRFQWR